MVRLDAEKRLTALFDYQRFEQDPALQRLIEDVEARYFVRELSDDALRTISAAGDPFARTPDPKGRDKPL